MQGFELQCSKGSREGIAIASNTSRLVIPKSREQTQCCSCLFRGSLSQVIQTRGIGPNPRESSYDFLIDALQNYFEIRIIELNDNSPDQSEHLVIVLENYPLPGMDFDKSLDQTVLEWAKNYSLGKVTVIALRDSFNLPETGPLTTLCTYSFREESAIAATKWLAGLVKNIQHGDAFK